MIAHLLHSQFTHFAAQEAYWQREYFSALATGSPDASVCRVYWKEYGYAAQNVIVVARQIGVL